MSPPFAPRLRADLLVEPGADGVVVTDPLLRRRLNLGDIGDVLDRLDGRPVEALSPTGGLADPRTEQVVRTLLLLSMLEGAGEPERARLRRSAPLPLVTLPSARFSCQGSGGCCRNYIFGPLTDADVARVEALDLSAFDLGSGPFYTTRPRPDGTMDRYLQTTAAGACRFLEAGDRCGLHTRFGGASKPGFCQLFPLVAWQTVTGLRVYDGGECVSFPASASGATIAAAWEDVRGLVPEPPLSNPVVHLAPGAPCDLAWFLPVLDALVTRVADDVSPVATLRGIGAGLTAAITSLRRCPLTEDGPRAAAAAARDAAARDAVAAPGARVEEGHAAIVAISRALAEIFAAPLSGPGAAPPYTAEIVAALRRLEDAAGGGPALPAEDPATRALWALAFRQRLFGQRALVDGRPRPAALRLCFDWLVARACPAGERAGHLLAARRLDMPWQPVHRLFIQAESALEPVLDALDTL
jgi:hypothetical protein